jgi:hypothetical protein
MANKRIILRRPRHSTSHPTTPLHSEPLDHALELVEIVCSLAGAESLLSEATQLQQAILGRDTPYLFEHLVRSFSLQGISDRAALTYMEKHDRPTWRDLELATEIRSPPCPKLRSYWSFENCGYQKGHRSCTEPARMSKCLVPRLDLRNGRLNQLTYSIFFFIRDVMQGDLVGWIDRSLAQAASGQRPGRLHRMCHALMDPLRNVYGVSDKVLNMTLADVLLAAPIGKPLWRETGASMIAIDTLVHNFLSRTGITSRLGISHAYGTACYTSNGCADIVRRIARRIDVRQFNPDYPRNFPRFVQHAIWRYCAQSELNVCNGNNIDDRFRCSDKDCPFYHRCSRVALHAQ